MKTNTVVQNWTIKILKKLSEIVPTHPLEGQFRHEIEPLFDEFCGEVGVSPVSHVEYTLATGRADAVFNRLIIEYEHPGILKNPPDGETQKSIQQVKDYMQGVAEKEHHKLTRLAGIVFDGVYAIFVRYIGDDWAVEKPVEVSTESIGRVLTWLASLASGIALTSENLTNDFSIEQPRTQEILLALYGSLNKSLEKKESMVSKLFEQWKVFFSESIDYSEAFGGEKLKDVHKWVRKAGIRVKNGEDAERFFFALHTYFALLTKFLAWLALSRELAPKIGAPSFGELITADSTNLRDRLEEMERGGIFRKFGLVNLLEGDFFLWYIHVWNPSVEKPIRNLLKRLDEYDPATLAIVPEETRDLFKELYHSLLPREIRHNLGEYYTPDWLAQELLSQIDPQVFSRNSSLTDLDTSETALNQEHDTTVRLSNGAVFHRPEERIREYCAIEVYRDRGYRGGYDDHHSITDVVTVDDLEAADNLYAHMNSEDRRRIRANPQIPSKLAAVRDAELGEVSDEEWEHLRAAVRPLLAEFLSIPNVKLAKTMKVLHLKRPHLFPILDSFVVKFLTGNDLEENRFSEEELLQIGIASLETARADIVANGAAFHELQYRLSDLPTPLTAVRIYDILCWTQEKWVNRGDTSAPRGTASLSLDQGPSTEAEPPSNPSPGDDLIRQLSKPQPRGEIATLREFRQVVSRAEGVIVITGTSPPRAHSPLCDLLTDDRFNSNVVLSGGKGGRYYQRGSLSEARREFGAVPCKRCGAGESTRPSPEW